MDDKLTQEDLTRLLAHRADPCISLYIPTYREGSAVKENAIRFRNGVAEAQRLMEERGMKESDAAELLAPLRARVEDTAFWRTQSDGLATFLSPSLHLSLRLPSRLPSLTVVDKRLYVKPLFRFASQALTFHVLAISQKDVRLFDGSQYGLTEVYLSGVPRSVDEALQLERSATQLQMHNSARGAEHPGTYHGQEPWPDKHKRYLQEFLHRVEEALHPYWQERTGPLVFAGVNYLYPLYAGACRYPELAKEFIVGNPDGMDLRELRERAVGIAGPIVIQWEEAMIREYRRLAASRPERILSDLTAILPAAYQGRLTSLMVADDMRRWGIFDPNSGRVDTDISDDDPAGEDLADRAVLYTMEHGGKIFARPLADIPNGKDAIAILNT